MFLDRDGTLVEEVAYLHDPDRVVLLPGVGSGLRRLAAARAVLEARRGVAADMAEGQTRPGRDGAGLTWDAGWSRVTAPLTGTSSGWSGPPRIPRFPRPSAAVLVPCRFRRAPPVSPPVPL